MAAIVFLALLFPTLSQASSWEECQFRLVVKKRTKFEVRVGAIEFIAGNGMGGSPGKANCLKWLESKIINLENVEVGKYLLRSGKKLKAIRRSYSAMGPAGPVSGVSWKFYRVQRAKKKNK